MMKKCKRKEIIPMLAQQITLNVLCTNGYTLRWYINYINYINHINYTTAQEGTA
jgi:hypothetical protein